VKKIFFILLIFLYGCYNFYSIKFCPENRKDVWQMEKFPIGKILFIIVTDSRTSREASFFASEKGVLFHLPPTYTNITGLIDSALIDRFRSLGLFSSVETLSTSIEEKINTIKNGRMEYLNSILGGNLCLIVEILHFVSEREIYRITADYELIDLEKMIAIAQGKLNLKENVFIKPPYKKIYMIKKLVNEISNDIVDIYHGKKKYYPFTPTLIDSIYIRKVINTKKYRGLEVASTTISLFSLYISAKYFNSYQTSKYNSLLLLPICLSKDIQSGHFALTGLTVGFLLPYYLCYPIEERRYYLISFPITSIIGYYLGSKIRIEKNPKEHIHWKE